MTPLPDPEVLARLVTSVTVSMLGIAFRPVTSGTQSVSKWRTALLPIDGPRPVTVGLSSDHESCSALCAAMFSCAPEAVEPDMVDDSLRELTNMTAGLVKASLALDQVLGLPRILPGHDKPVPSAPPFGQSVMVKADALGLFLWVSEGIEKDAR